MGGGSCWWHFDQSAPSVRRSGVYAWRRYEASQPENFTSSTRLLYVCVAALRGKTGENRAAPLVSVVTLNARSEAHLTSWPRGESAVLHLYTLPKMQAASPLQNAQCAHVREKWPGERRRRWRDRQTLSFCARDTGLYTVTIKHLDAVALCRFRVPSHISPARAWWLAWNHTRASRPAWVVFL